MQRNITFSTQQLLRLSGLVHKTKNDTKETVDPLRPKGIQSNRPFATNDHMVQNPPCWRASSLLFPHWDIKTKASQA